jgi:ABC-type lipopolysaccharide export system ATPase subunit
MYPNAYTISGLKRKRGEIAGQILIVKGQVRLLQDDLAAIDRSLGLLDPSN